MARQRLSEYFRLKSLTAPQVRELEQTLSAVLASAQRAWPGLRASAEGFASYLAERAPKNGDLLQWLAGLEHEDLYLAYTCSQGNAAALSAFEERWLAQVGRFVARIDASPQFADEVRQELRHKLLLAKASGDRKICEYRGEGPLAAWLRVAALRTARDLRRGRKPDEALDGERAMGALAQAPDVELGVLQRLHQPDFRAAFQEALAALSIRDRNILALHFLDHLASDAIAKMYGVSGQSVRLWLKRCREELLRDTTRRLAARLELSPREVKSLIAALRSQIDVSIERLLRPQG
jgi:RNA polymerase sigma-70 factor (ECF subfamily)